MGETVKWVASDTAIRPRVNLTRDGTPVDLSAASLISIQFQQIVASGVTAPVASYLATIYSGATPAQGIVESLHYPSAPLATAGQWRTQVRITSASGVETFDSPFTVILGRRF